MFARSVALSSLGTLLSLAGCAESHGTCVGACPDASVVDARVVGSDSGPVLDATLLIDAPVTSCLPRAPIAHRSDPAACDRVRGPGSPDPDGFPGSCASDAECTEGENGRCTSFGRGGAGCTYDQCFVDADCGAGSTCDCGAGNAANICRPSNCASDGDCATGFCSPTFGGCGAFTGTVGYYCHTCEDECINDSDCGGDGSYGSAYCAFEPTVGRWMCSTSHCAG